MSQQLMISGQRRRALALVVWALVLLCPQLAIAETIGVLFPQTREPFRQVYTNIIEGVEAEYQGPVERLVIGPDTTAKSIQDWMDRKNIRGVVVLGKESLDRIPPGAVRPLVVGGSIIPPGSQAHPGITLNPAPGLLFAGLLKLRPEVRDIHVVYEPDYNGWVIEAAERAAQELGIRLHSHPVTGLREAAARYREVQQTLKSRSEALWLPLGGPSREKSILQKILETAWARDQIIISSNLADVRRGAFYALYPDNRGMGMELARLLKMRMADGESATEPVFLSALYQALNLRTAEHLGLRLDREGLKAFDFIYPPQ